MVSYYRSTGLANGTYGGEQMSSDFNGFTHVLPYHGEAQEDIDPLKLMQMYGGREIMSQPSLSSSYCSSFSSSPSPEYLMVNGSNTASTAAGIRQTNSAQVSSMIHEDMVMSSSIQPTPITTSANSFNQPDNIFNPMAGHDNGAHAGGTSGSAAGTLTNFSFQLNNEDHPGPSLVSHDQNPRAQYPCLSDIAPYYASPIVADSSTPLPSLLKPITEQPEIQYDQAYIDDGFFSESMLQSLQCAFNASCTGELADGLYGMSLQTESYAPEIGGLGCSHDEEAIAVQHRSCSQVQRLGMSLPLLKCAETSQISTSQNNNHQPGWGSIYSNIDIYGRHRLAPRQGAAHEVPGGAAHDASTVLSTNPAACSFTDQDLQAQAKLDQPQISVAQTQGITSINQGLMGLIGSVSEAYHDTFSHNHIPNHDEGVQMPGLSTGIAPTSCPNPASAASTYVGDYNVSAERMHQESIRRINELIKRGSSGQSNMHMAQYQPQEMSYVNRSDMNNNVSSSIGIPQNEAHVMAERKRRRKQGDSINILSTLVPLITKKRDKATKKDKVTKVTVLESTIEYIKGMQALACKHEKDKVSLGNTSNKDYEGETKISCNSQHAETVIKSSQNISSKTNATCKYIHSPSGQEILPHFQLCLSSSVKTVNSNVPIIDIITALQKKSLHCIDLKSEFLESTSCIVVKILATYKDGKNCTPNMDEIQCITQWWRHLIIDQLSAKWK